MDLLEKRAELEARRRMYASAKLAFHSVDGLDVYHPSLPFKWPGRPVLRDWQGRGWPHRDGCCVLRAGEVCLD